MIAHPLATWAAVARHGSFAGAASAHQEAVAQQIEPAHALWARAVELAAHTGFRGPRRTFLLCAAGQLAGEPLAEDAGGDAEDARLATWTRRLIEDRQRASAPPRLVGDALCAAGDLAGAEAAYAAARDDETEAAQARVLALQVLLCRHARRGGTCVGAELEAWTDAAPTRPRPRPYDVLAFCALADARRESGDAHAAVAAAASAQAGAQATHARTLEALAVAVLAEAREQQGDRVVAQRAARDGYQLAEADKTLVDAQVHVRTLAAWARIAYYSEDRTRFAYLKFLEDAVAWTWEALPRDDALSQARLSVAAAQVQAGGGRGEAAGGLAGAAYFAALDELAAEPGDVRWALVAQAAAELIDEHDPPPDASAALAASQALATATGGRSFVAALGWARTAESLERRRLHGPALDASEQALAALPGDQSQAAALDDALAAAAGRCALSALLRDEAPLALELLVPAAARDADRFLQRAITVDEPRRVSALITQRRRQGSLAAALLTAADHPDLRGAAFAGGVEALLAAKGLLRDAADAALALARLDGRTLPRPLSAATMLARAADALAFADQAMVARVMSAPPAAGLLDRLMDRCGRDRLLVDLVVVPDAAGPGQPANAVEHFYLAIVVWDAGCAVLALGTQEDVDMAVGRGRNVLESPRSDAAAQRSAAEALDTLILGGVRRCLPNEVGDRQQWVVGLDGAANFAPLGASGPLGADVLAEGTALRLTESLRRWAEDAPPPSARPPVVIGGPDYRSGVPPEVHQRWPRLPGAVREAEEVAALWSVAPVTGPAATREAVLDVHHPTVLHLATHGTVADGGPTVSYRPDALDTAAVLEHLERSVIALAGADAGDTGTLSAREIGGLDLRGTRLAVLSACDTALGGALPGEEILGLRHALRTAGAQQVLTSLWRVPDERAADLMITFQDALAADVPAPAALARAQDQARRGGSGPRVWAAWQLLGTHAAG
jgi:hypothetical protein